MICIEKRLHSIICWGVSLLAGSLYAQDSSAQTAKNPLIRSYQQLIEQSDIKDEDETNQIRQMLIESDKLLTRIKQENADALRNVNRQVPGIGAPLPNLIVISVDDLSTGSLGCYGNELAKTPNIDSLASTGVKFTNFHAGSPLDADSFWCLMTGQHSGAVERDTAQLPMLSSGKRTLISQLWHAGYSTGYFGVWPLAGSTGPQECESDLFVGWRSTNRTNELSPSSIEVNGTTQKLNDSAQSAQTAWSISTLQALAALERREAGRPFAWVIRYQTLKFPEDRDTAAELDREIGRVLHRLDQLALRENTLIWLLGETSRSATDKPSRDEILDSMKANQLRVPSIVNYPPFQARGRVRSAPAGIWDVTATLTSITRDRRYLNPAHGISLYEQLVSGKKSKARILYWSVPTDSSGNAQAVRQGDWKAVLPPGDKQVQLFDLNNDPDEQQDVAADHPEIVQRMIRPNPEQ